MFRATAEFYSKAEMNKNENQRIACFRRLVAPLDVGLPLPKYLHYADTGQLFPHCEPRLVRNLGTIKCG